MSQRKATPAASLTPSPRSSSPKCAESDGCQYRPDPERSDGRCTWHGQVADYKTSGDRGVLFNRGLCGEDEIGPRIGQLCTFSKHHEECPVGVQQRERAQRAAETTKPLTPHQIALGQGRDSA